MANDFNPSFNGSTVTNPKNNSESINDKTNSFQVLSGFEKKVVTTSYIGFELRQFVEPDADSTMIYITLPSKPPINACTAQVSH